MRTNYLASILLEDGVTVIATGIPVNIAFAATPSLAEIGIMENAKDEMASHIITLSENHIANIHSHYYFLVAGSYYEMIRTQRISEYLNSQNVRCLCRLDVTR